MTNAYHKRIQAFSAKDSKDEQTLLSDAVGLETGAKSKQAEALQLQDIANSCLFLNNSVKLDQIRVTNDNDASIASAKQLENESSYYFNKAQAILKTLKGNITDDQRTSILTDAFTNEQNALQVQSKAIDIYSNYSPSATSNKTKSATATTATTQNKNKGTVTNTNNPVVANNQSTETTQKTNNTEAKTVSTDTTAKTTSTNITVIKQNTDTAKKVITTEAKTVSDTSAKTSSTNIAAIKSNNADTAKKVITTESKTVTDTTAKTPVVKIAETKQVTENKQKVDNTVPIATTNTSVTTPSATIVPNDFKGVYLSDRNDFKPLNVDADNLIPLNPTIPSGVVFKVQICAVKRHVDPKAFNGITPVTGEVTPGGLIYYMAGLFTTYEDANAEMNKIRAMGGYPDDFVVAYYNGYRIPIYQALALLRNDATLYKKYADLNNSSYFSTGSGNSFNALPVNIDKVANGSGLSNPITNLPGFFYSVQVGVYGRPVTSTQLFGISPLYDRKLAKGYYLYIAGTFKTLQEATAAKNVIVDKGIKDAFVVAYNDGKEITIYEARNLAGK
jgi:hypothetical protein